MYDQIHYCYICGVVLTGHEHGACNACENLIQGVVGDAE